MIDMDALPIEDSSGVQLSDLVPVATCHAALGKDVEHLVGMSLSTNTQRGYLSDLAHFGSWGGLIPSDPGQIANYLAAHRHSLSVATLERRIASLSKAHTSRSLPNPTHAELVKATLRGIKRTTERRPRQAEALVVDSLRALLRTFGNGVIDIRDTALLLVGFAGGFRRSELVSFDLDDVQHVRRGIVLTLRRSKTDQTGDGRKIGIPFGRTDLCPVHALGAWCERAAIAEGPIFRSVDRAGRPADQRLSAEAVSLIIKRRMAAAGWDPSGYSGHSLRAGFATSAAEAGAPSHKIRAQTGHASDAMLQRYIRDADLFRGNAASMLL